MKKYLAKFDGNYADEFDLSGIRVWDEAKVNAFKEGAVEYFKKHSDLEIYFGTNEAMIWESASDVLSDVTFTEITDEEIEVLQRLLGEQWQWPGWFPDFLDHFNGAYE